MVTLPDHVLTAMARAMLDPTIRRSLTFEGVRFEDGALPSGNAVRIEVLKRALLAASALGWELQPVKTGYPRP